MKIAIVSAFYSEGMGYAENCLPKALVELGHEVHVITSRYNVYGNEPYYEKTYASFLGPADQGVREFAIDGYAVHRLGGHDVGRYVYIPGVAAKVRALRPDIVHATEIAALNTFAVAAVHPISGFRLFTETHQHMSVVKPYMKGKERNYLKQVAYRLTRTLPSWLAALTIEKCYAISADCADVAATLYGVPRRKIRIQPLGTDTELFRPAFSPAEADRRLQARSALGYRPGDIVCVYTGRFSEDKNPLVLAKAVEQLAQAGRPFHALFVGEGVQAARIGASQNVTIRPFMKHVDLADIYRAADIAVWPRQESMSMLDAAASGLPLVISDRAEVKDRIEGNGRVFREDDPSSLASVLDELASPADRARMAAIGRQRMVERFSWQGIARGFVKDYEYALGRASSAAHSG